MSPAWCTRSGGTRWGGWGGYVSITFVFAVYFNYRVGNCTDVVFCFTLTGCSRQVEWRAGARELPATPGRWRVAGHVRGGGRAAHVGDRAEGEPGSG